MADQPILGTDDEHLEKAVGQFPIEHRSTIFGGFSHSLRFDAKRQKRPSIQHRRRRTTTTSESTSTAAIFGCSGGWLATFHAPLASDSQQLNMALKGVALRFNERRPEYNAAATFRGVPARSRARLPWLAKRDQSYPNVDIGELRADT
ncbi:hypothetical protein Purlil1_13126 [Purpureocillium lilacinum]|uniref:Uncharacterized protein n=1 Tax=Purpureocillium lilacinum TaxID=33203 RepID=A0ABR0BEX8_PURLI|nr:hypothetical protein Purlil1_13126 [Purpureocillium lilacinum]